MPSARTIRKTLVNNIRLIQSPKGEPLVSNIVLIQSPKREPLVSNIRLIQSPKGEPLVSNIVLIQSPKREPLVSNIIIILGETKLPHSLAKPDCYACSNSLDNCRVANRPETGGTVPNFQLLSRFRPELLYTQATPIFRRRVWLCVDY